MKEGIHMINFIKQFKHRISKDVQTIIFFLIILFSVIISIIDIIEVIDLLQILVIQACILGAVILLYVKKKFVASHIILLLMLYANGIGALVRSLFSYNFSLGVFTAKPEWDILVAGIISLYLILLTLSYSLDEKVTFKFEVSNVLIMIVLVSVYLYVRYSLATMLLALIPALIALFAGVPLAAMLILICQLIGLPFELLDAILDQGLDGYSLFYYVIRVIGLGLLGYLIFKTYKLFFAKK
jgi:hypothetical protein